jgi:hypothetical protein
MFQTLIFYPPPQMINKMRSDDGLETSEAARKKKIRELNDRLRQTGEGGQVVATQGICALDASIQIDIANKIKTFNEFTPDNDPYKEHDFGMVEVAGIRCFWKIDYHDENTTMHSPDKSDPEVTNRVMTIMLADEY